MGGVHRHCEIPIGKNTGVLKDFTVGRRALLLHFIGIREITVENQHGKLAIGNPLLFAATDETGDMFDESSEKGSGFLLAPCQCKAVKGCRIWSRSDLALPLWVEHILDFLWNIARGDEIGIVSEPR